MEAGEHRKYERIGFVVSACGPARKGRWNKTWCNTWGSSHGEAGFGASLCGRSALRVVVRGEKRVDHTRVQMVLSPVESDQVVQWLQSTRLLIQARSPVRSPAVLADQDALFIDLDTTNVSVHAKMRSPSYAVKNRDGVVLLHGMCSSTYTWRHLLQPLANIHSQRVLAFDRPPFGLSTRPKRAQVRRARRTSAPNPYSLKFGMHMTVELMDKLEMPAATLVAHSLGATSAIEFALSFPERVNSIVLIAPSVRFHSTSSKLLRGDVRRLLGLPVIGASIIHKSLAPLLKCSHAFDRAVSRNFHRPHRVYSEEFVRNYVQPMLAPGWVHGVQQSLRALEPYDYIKTVRSRSGKRWNTDIPVLVISGAHDEIIPSDDCVNFVRALRDVGSRVRHEIVPDCGHIPQEEQPLLVEQILTRWVCDSQDLSNSRRSFLQ